MLLSGNLQSEHVAAGERVQTSILRKLNILSLCGQCFFNVTSNLNMSQQWKAFIQRYYLNFNNLSLCRAVLLSCNFQSEHVAAGVMFKTTILSEPYHFKLL